MGVLRHWASDVWLRIFLIFELELSPIVVKVRGEGGIRMSIFRHWSSDIWLWILLIIQLKLSPIIMEMARES
jgi:hypothetical protein